MTPKQILKAARAKIADPLDWGQGLRGVDRPMNTCCAAEAIEAVTGNNDERRAAFRILRYAIGHDVAVTKWNDSCSSHDEVIKTYNLAIAITV